MFTEEEMVGKMFRTEMYTNNDVREVKIDTNLFLSKLAIDKDVIGVKEPELIVTPTNEGVQYTMLITYMKDVSK